MLAEVEDILRTMPPRPTIRHELDENVAWLGRAAALVTAWGPLRAIDFQGYIRRLHGLDAHDSTPAFRQMVTMLHQVRHDLRMRTIGPLSIVVGQGMVFDYFDEMRKILENPEAGRVFCGPLP